MQIENAEAKQSLRVLAFAPFSRIVLAALSLSIAAEALAANGGTFSVVDFGAVGDGATLDTDAINQAVAQCSQAGGGQVLFPPGKYLSGTVHLKSNVTLVLQAAATLVGSDNLDSYAYFRPPADTHEAKFRPQWHRGLILGVDAENVAIVGDGVIDGARVFDPNGEERMRGPHTVLLGDCTDVTIRGVTIRDSANYAVMLEHCSDVDVRNVKVAGGWDAVHFRGWAGRPCRNVNILDCQFFTGDDCIAGRYWENVVIKNCVINSSCNGIRVIGPAENLIVQDCLFYGPGLHPHRTSKRTKMLAGIILQPGAWDSTEGRLDQVLISNNTMRDVATPLEASLNPGNTAGEIVVERLSATGVHRAACSVESWTNEPIERFVLRGASIEYEGGVQKKPAADEIPKPGLDARELPTWGFFARNVKRLDLQDVRLGLEQPDLRHALIFSDVEELNIDGLRYPEIDGAAEPIAFDEVDRASVLDAPTSAPSSYSSSESAH